MGAVVDTPHKTSYWSDYACVYDEGVDYVVGRALRRAVAGRLALERHLGNTIECGCGTGFYTKVIAAHAARVTAMDISAEMLQVADQELASFHNVFLQRADAEKMPFAPNTFDSALLANILNTVKDPPTVLGECFRVLKFGGQMIAIAYTDYGMAGTEKTDLGLRYFQKFGMPPSWGLHNFGPEELGNLVRQKGFTVRKLTVLGDKPKALYLRAAKDVTLGKG